MSWNSGSMDDGQWEFPGGYDAFSPALPVADRTTLVAQTCDTAPVEPQPARAV